MASLARYRASIVPKILFFNEVLLIISGNTEIQSSISKLPPKERADYFRAVVDRTNKKEMFVDLYNVTENNQEFQVVLK